MAILEPDLFDGSAAALFCRLRDLGFELAKGNGGRLLIKPIAGLTGELRSATRRHKDALLELVRILDRGVQARRDVFTKQQQLSPGAVGPFLFRPDIPYQRGTCFSCGDRLPESRFGRCRRCSLAWRLACQLPVSAEVARTYDNSKVVA